MEWHVSKSRGHQSVHDKALTIFQERIKSLAVAEREIEKERVQSNIELKTEKRKVQLRRFVQLKQGQKAVCQRSQK